MMPDNFSNEPVVATTGGPDGAWSHSHPLCEGCDKQFADWQAMVDEVRTLRNVTTVLVKLADEMHHIGDNIESYWGEKDREQRQNLCYDLADEGIAALDEWRRLRR